MCQRQLSKQRPGRTTADAAVSYRPAAAARAIAIRW
jgi:hypothetical protein